MADNPYAPGQPWDSNTDRAVDTSVPGYILTQSGHYVDAHTDRYVASPTAPPVPTILPDHRGDGGTPAASTDTSPDFPSEAAWAGFTTAAFRTLPQHCFRARQATRAIRKALT